MTKITHELKLKLKRCNKCKEEKDINEYHIDRQNNDGFRASCKVCTLAHQATPKYLARARERAHSEPYKAVRRNYERTKYHTDSAFATRKKARAIAFDHSSRGNIELTPCVNCGTSDNIENHHPDYDKPKEIICLCCKCHREYHYEETRKEKEEAQTIKS